MDAFCYNGERKLGAKFIVRRYLQESAKQLDMGQGEQRTAEWHAERDKRLTASAFGNALGCSLLSTSSPGYAFHAL